MFFVVVVIVVVFLCVVVFIVVVLLFFVCCMYRVCMCVLRTVSMPETKTELREIFERTKQPPNERVRSNYNRHSYVL
jgi:cytochrome c-type biogenesis protein CcmH/NrfG